MGKPSGPPMVVVTNVIQPGPARIGKLTKRIVLPRTVRLSALISTGAGSIIGGLLAAALSGFDGFIIGVIIGAVLGYGAVTWSPYPGETVWSFAGVMLVRLARTASGFVNVHQTGHTRYWYQAFPAGKTYLGTAPCTHHRPLGRFFLIPGAVDVHPENIDERGALRTRRNRNLRRGQGVGLERKPAPRVTDWRIPITRSYHLVQAAMRFRGWGVRTGSDRVPGTVAAESFEKAVPDGAVRRPVAGAKAEGKWRRK